MTAKYDDLTREQLIELLEKRDRIKKLGLVWERDEIEADAAIDANFVACQIVPDLSDLAAPWDNLVIEGDNFDALRWLRMTHAGRVKCIYIDPPYNSGNKDWVYNDHYIDTALLHEPVDCRTAPVPGRTYPMTLVKGMPSAV